MTEEITLIHKGGLSDALYQKAMELWGAERTGQVIMAIIAINSWNRIAVATRMMHVHQMQLVGELAINNS